MSDRCVENFREFGVELTVSETIKEIINALHSDGKPLHKVVYDVQSGQFGFVFDDGRFKHLLQLGQEPSEEVKKLKILLEETFDQVKRLERESGAAIAQAVDSKKSSMKSDAETKEVLEKLRAKEKELAAEKKARKKAEAVLQKKLEEDVGKLKELKRTQDRLAEKSRQMTVVEREAQAFKDKAESKDATVLRQSKQLAELVESRQEDSRKLQMAESKAKEAEEKRRREEELRRQLEAVRDELTDGLESCHESIKEYKAEVAELSANWGSAERRNAAMAEDLRFAKGWSAFSEK